MSSVLVVCVGNSLVSDDGAGPAVYERLSSIELPAAVRVELLGVGGISLLDLLKGESMLIVVDAVRFGAPVGTVHQLEWDDLPEPSGGQIGAHGVGVREAIELGRRVDPDNAPERVVVVGIEGRNFNTFDDMSPAVVDAVERACDAVLERVCAAARVE